MRNDVKEQLSQLRKELEREKSERLNLEKEVIFTAANYPPVQQSLNECYLKVEALRRKLDG